MKNLLIVEDDPAIAKGVQASLEEFAYNVISEPDGEKGYQHCLK